VLDGPICIYDNWSAYDELSDTIELTEELALRQLDELLRLRRSGVRLDYYLMDAFWYDPDGGYRTWRKPHWRDGPDRWLDRCLEHDVKPGLWISSNTLCKLNPIPAWQESLTESRSAACFFHGGFWPHLLETLHIWYERGVRLFKFDFLDLYAAPPSLEQTMLPHTEILPLNIAAFKTGLRAFRAAHPGVVLTAYNGFEEHRDNAPKTPHRKFIGTHWLEAFDSVYCGDPAPSDVPAMSFFRSVDIFSDLRVQAYQRNGFPLHRIDNCSFMGGPAGTCYGRNDTGWKGMLILSLARGGWVNSYHGTLELYDDDDAAWFARVQRMFLPLQRHGRIFTFGGDAAGAQPHGFAAHDSRGALFALVNPSQSQAALCLPPVPLDAGAPAGLRLLFQDAGFPVQIENRCVSLGPEQLALIGAGCYSDPACSLGVQPDIVIPFSISPLPADFQPAGGGAISAAVTAGRPGALRIVARQLTPEGLPRKLWSQHHGEATMGTLLRLAAEQDGRPLPITIDYDRKIWSGLSWAVGEIPAGAFDPGRPITVRFHSEDASQPVLQCQLYLVQYD